MTTFKNKDGIVGINGWLLVYLLSSIPLIVFYSGAFSGWVLDYPLWLVIPILITLAIPLVLIILKSNQAPKWNIIELWVIAVLLPLRIITGILTGDMGRVEEFIIPLVLIVLFPIFWAIIWTKYFKNSVRVRNTFKIS
ncbi:MAG: hypothetical protein HKO01_04735 [Flaviramulus sp.]|nr:DUF2569 family protein [Flaviramulus sp.]NNC49821.1 hypothetical protein [Flaviramulus sp.]